MKMNTTLVINPKGGSGKTTVSTNLASYFAARGIPTTILDYDPQGSSVNWLELRKPPLNNIHAANAAPRKGVGLRSFDRYVPPETRQLILDAPAGTAGLLLQELLSKADCIVIPVASSAIDIRATADFIRDLLLGGRLRIRNIRLGVVANKVRKSMPVYQPLERFLTALSLPLLTRLGDSDVFLQAAETGTGIFEMDAVEAEAECAQFQPIGEWVGGEQQALAPRMVEKVVSIHSRFPKFAIS
jgi:chromosome partitioning protein